MKAIQWKQGTLELLDQTALPLAKKTLICREVNEVVEAIKMMKVRGAPAIGVSAAYGLVLSALAYSGQDSAQLLTCLERAKDSLAATRPTAVNLFWALQRMKKVWEENEKLTVTELKALLEQEAQSIDAEDDAQNRALGRFGAVLVPDGANILTHCNAGALATAGYGTALGVVRAACEQGKKIHVYADETRPLLQGARLTVWELMEDHIPVTLITDNMAGYLMQQGKIDLVIVGADRITAQADVANKIGTYSVAVLANYHRIPFYVAAPLSTIDTSLQDGAQIPIEERHAEEVSTLGGKQITPTGAAIYNPAFDLTPAALITAIITEAGVIKPPYAAGIAQVFQAKKGD